jgi:hypothetical protein
MFSLHQALVFKTLLLLAIAAALLRVAVKAGADASLRQDPSVGSSRNYSRSKDSSFVTTYMCRGAVGRAFTKSSVKLQV